MRILLVEDDSLIADGVQQALKRKAYQVDWVSDGGQGLSAALDNPFDLIILDLGLPGLDGMDLLTKLRQQNNNTPTIIVSARDSTRHKIDGLNAGADDYLTKPFELEELFARIHAIERRMGGGATNMLTMGDVCLDVQAMTVAYKGEVVPLQRREFSLVRKLMENPKQVFTRDQLEESLYGWVTDVGSNAIDVHVHNLRKKFYPAFIKTMRGVGYRIDPDLQ